MRLAAEDFGDHSPSNKKNTPQFKPYNRFFFSLWVIIPPTPRKARRSPANGLKLNYTCLFILPHIMNMIQKCNKLCLLILKNIIFPQINLFIWFLVCTFVSKFNYVVKRAALRLPSAVCKTAFFVPMPKLFLVYLCCVVSIY